MFACSQVAEKLVHQVEFSTGLNKVFTKLERFRLHTWRHTERITLENHLKWMEKGRKSRKSYKMVGKMQNKSRKLFKVVKKRMIMNVSTTCRDRKEA